MNINHFVHDFKNDLLWSEAPPQYIPYMQAVSHWWPDAISWNRVLDKEQQQLGKDMIVILPDNRSLNIQFKSRTRCYSDCSIEYQHDFDNGSTKPGWMETPCTADFLLYRIPKGVPYGTTDFVPQCVYRIDYHTLHLAWINNKNTWLKDKFFRPDARNNTYWTRNVAIPWSILEKAGVDIDVLEIME